MRNHHKFNIIRFFVLTLCLKIYQIEFGVHQIEKKVCVGFKIQFFFWSSWVKNSSLSPNSPLKPNKIGEYNVLLFENIILVYILMILPSKWKENVQLEIIYFFNIFNSGHSLWDRHEISDSSRSQSLIAFFYFIFIIFF